jgi:predicted DNA-binding transcriptional regulator YafY
MGTISQSFRLKILDQCLRNPIRRYRIVDLIEECKKRFIERKGTEFGVSRKTIYNDLEHIQERYDVEIDKTKDGKFVYWSYSDKNFSIDNEPLNKQEAILLKTAIQTILSFSGLPQFDLLEPLSRRLDKTFDLNQDHRNIVGFENNLSLIGITFLKDVFNAIKEKQVLEIMYQSFNSKEAKKIEFHPYFMKQYNSRWFVLGLNPDFSQIGPTNLAFDRIKSITTINSKAYIESNEDYLNDYFYDFVGVTNSNDEIENVILRVNKGRWKYMDTKPIHHSYKVISKSEDYVVVNYKVKINQEFKSKVLEYGKDLKVIKPDHLRKEIKDILNSALRQYD